MLEVSHIIYEPNYNNDSQFSTMIHSKMAVELKRCDPVVYMDAVYYFQPDGNACYLYKHQEDVGCISLAKYHTQRSSIRRANPEEIALHEYTINNKPILTDWSLLSRHQLTDNPELDDLLAALRAALDND